MTYAHQATGNITTDSIRTMRDLGEAYYNATQGIESDEFIDMFRDDDGDIDFEALAQGALDSAPTPMGEFVDDGDTYQSGGHTVYSGWTWFRNGFDDQFWNAIEAAYPAA